MTKPKSGLTAIELLTVVTVAGIIAAVLFPAVQQARETARRFRCRNNLKQIGLGWHGYHDSFRVLSYGWDVRGRLWSANLLPQLDHPTLYRQLRPHEHGTGNWYANGSPNEAACGTPLAVFRCPSMSVPRHFNSSGIPRRFPSSYRANAGTEASSDDTKTIVIAGTKSLEMLQQDGVFFACSRIRFADLNDGLSVTVLVGESLTDPRFIKDGQGMDHWLIGSPQVDPCLCDGGPAGTEFSEAVGTAVVPMNLRRHSPTAHGSLMELSFGSYHERGANFVMADGSVRFVADQIELAVYQALFSRSRGDFAD